jgi:hypothetical protein
MLAPIAHTTMREEQPDVLGLNLKRSELYARFGLATLQVNRRSGKNI